MDLANKISRQLVGAFNEQYKLKHKGQSWDADIDLDDETIINKMITDGVAHFNKLNISDFDPSKGVDVYVPMKRKALLTAAKSNYVQAEYKAAQSTTKLTQASDKTQIATLQAVITILNKLVVDDAKMQDAIPILRYVLRSFIKDLVPKDSALMKVVESLNGRLLMNDAIGEPGNDTIEKQQVDAKAFINALQPHVSVQYI